MDHNINLTKHIFGKFTISSSNLIGIYGPKQFSGTGLSDEEIKKVIQNPIGVKPLSSLAKGRKNALIVTDDNTRPTPLKRLLPHILDELKAGGLSNDKIIILVGLGTHRPMTPGEINDKFGDQIVSRYKIVNHEWNNPDALESLGKCELGFEIFINKLVKQSDLIIAVGNIVPHATAGFSGGGKALMPGICGEKNIEETHWKALDFSMNEILGEIDNPIQDAIKRVSNKAKLSMIINTVLFGANEIYALVAGDLEKAYAMGIGYCREVYGVAVPDKADIVVAEAFPTDIDLRQAIKAICSADVVCKDGGVIIVAADCPDGVSPQFPEFSKYGFREPEKLFNDVNNRKFKNKLLAYTLVAIGRIISKNKSAILVSPNINREETERMGFIWAENMQKAVDMALKIMGNEAKAIVLKRAGELLPIVSSAQ